MNWSSRWTTVPHSPPLHGPSNWGVSRTQSSSVVGVLVGKTGEVVGAWVGRSAVKLGAGSSDCVGDAGEWVVSVSGAVVLAAVGAAGDTAADSVAVTLCSVQAGGEGAGADDSWLAGPVWSSTATVMPTSSPPTPTSSRAGGNVPKR